MIVPASSSDALPRVRPRLGEAMALSVSLWPEHTTQSARHSLNQNVYLIRQALGPDILELNPADSGLSRRIVFITTCWNSVTP